MEELLNSAYITFGGFLVVFFLAVLAYWRGDRMLFILSGFGFLFMGYDYWPDSYVLSILLVLIGLYQFTKAALA